MAAITRTEAIEQIQEVLKAYENKIRDIRFDTEKLSPEGKKYIVLTMSQFIESFLCDLEKYLSKEGEKLLKIKMEIP